jgi:transcriptional regulator with XRE-family HTH domain
MQMVGRRLRKLRKFRGLTLVDVADAVELSSSFISLVERGQAEISLGRFLRLADFFDISSSDLLREAFDESGPVIEPLSAGQHVDRGQGITYRVLSQPHMAIQVVHVKFQPQSQFADALTHAGQDFCIVVRGSVTLMYGDTNYDIRAGQSVSYVAATPHFFLNRADRVAEMVGIVGPAYW